MTKAEFDYIVVGAGSAGCALAGRLSEDADKTVAVIEAGARNDSLFVRWPAGFVHLQKPSNWWDWKTVAQPNCNGRQIPTPQGRLVGGGSAINGMVYIRGNKRDYDLWAEDGNDRWGYADVLPYFRKAEDNARLSDEWHGTGGPLGVSDQVSPSPLTRAFVLAGQEAGHRFNHDFNGEMQSGVGFYQVTQRRGQRCSSAHAYLYPAMGRPNLSLHTGIRVVRIIVEAGRAVGVEVSESGRSKVLRARREVIVSAGAINSAKLLMLSGIGKADDLQSHGIRPIVDLPGVGQNLQDHVDAYLSVRLKQPVSYTGHDRGLPAVRHGLQYMMFGTGAVTSNACEGGLFAGSDGNDEWPDVQLHFIPAMLSSHQVIGGHGVTVLSSALRPKSRGEVRLDSSDPFADPRIDPRFFSHADDMKQNVAALKIGREIVHAPSFRSLHDGEVFPGPQCRTDAEFAEYVRSTAKTDFHPVGTCRMGDDEDAVVDQQLRVKGIERLRVADASIMPYIVSGNTNAPSIMIGERAASMISAEGQ